MRATVVDDNIDAAGTLALFLDFLAYETRVICEAPGAVTATLYDDAAQAQSNLK